MAPPAWGSRPTTLIGVLAYFKLRPTAPTIQMMCSLCDARGALGDGCSISAPQPESRRTKRSPIDGLPSRRK